MTFFDVQRVREQFPILQQQINGYPLVYLDSAATAHKPECVLQAMFDFYRSDNANVHRSAHTLAARATHKFERARQRVADFLNARSSHEIIWTRGTTESINLVAQTWGRRNLQPGDELLLSAMEHHANLVTWQQIAIETGAQLRIIPLLENGDLDMQAYQNLLSARTRLVAVVQVSNVLGTVNPVAEIVRLAKQAGALTLIDGAQAVAHAPVDVQALDCDFYAFSGHKVYGPTGIGVLYGRQELLAQLPPWQFGGEMIEKVSFTETQFSLPPLRFEAGTPAIAEALGLSAALDFLCQQQAAGAEEYQQQLLQRLLQGLQQIDGVSLVGQPAQRQGVVSIVLTRAHHHDVCQLLDAQGIAVRSGHHCAMPLLSQLGLAGTLRISLGVYNSEEEIDLFLQALRQALELLHD
ncbi:aminotransferase class V-fold PLP-dependent enzyme [Tolumonas osonensis]|uniref:Cysteine desulfurase n=1 Tax=Tolumonas osonensis TaxID=675874 RepID=A0A841GQL9_9GAMM|nr:SufS family cysteine desulfurase [Tolumonas osonensis]MBB6056872.1 cysteine sulfinate desulfinase/cysteine desulfurase/selenocysteine lyase [Tolumonas osonensis]